MISLTRRLFSFFSLVLFSILVFTYLWWGKLQYHHSALLWGTYTGIVTLVLANHLYHADGRREMGFRLDNFGRAARWYGLLTLAAAGLVVGIGYAVSRPHVERWSDFYLYILWAVIQQHVLQNFLRLRSEELLSRRRTLAGFLAALLFALYHLPNLPLTAASFLGGVLWCLLYVRMPSFIWASVSQAVLSACLMLFFKFGMMNQFQVGKAGQRYDYYGSGVNLAGGYDAAGRPFVVAAPGADRHVPARIRLFTLDGKLQSEWTAFPDLDFSGQVAAGDLGYGPGDEIVVSPGPGTQNPAMVRIFNTSGVLLNEIRPGFKPAGYGAWVSIACGRIYLTPGPGPNVPGIVEELDPQGRLLSRHEFDFGFESSIRAVGLCGHGTKTAPASTLVLWGSPISVNPSRVFLYSGHPGAVTSFDPLRTTFGLNLAPVHLNRNELGLAISPGPLRGYPPIVYILDLQGNIVRQFVGSSDPDSCGTNVSAVDADGDGRDEILLGEGIGPGRPYTVRVLTQDAKLLYRWEAF